MRSYGHGYQATTTIVAAWQHCVTWKVVLCFYDGHQRLGSLMFGIRT
jgi:hypothetical protein